MNAMERQSTADRVAELLDWIRTGKALDLRVASGLTQREIAEDCDVTRDAVLRWERNERRPSGRNALAYHRVLSSLAARARDAA